MRSSSWLRRPWSVVMGADGFGGIERRREALLLAVVARPVPEFRAANAGRMMLADDVAVGVLAGHLVHEDVLRDDDVAFHTDHFSDVGDAAGALPRAGPLLHHVPRSPHHLPAA